MTAGVPIAGVHRVGQRPNRLLEQLARFDVAVVRQTGRDERNEEQRRRPPAHPVRQQEHRAINHATGVNPIKLIAIPRRSRAQTVLTDTPVLAATANDENVQLTARATAPAARIAMNPIAPLMKMSRGRREVLGRRRSRRRPLLRWPMRGCRRFRTTELLPNSRAPPRTNTRDDDASNWPAKENCCEDRCCAD